MFLGGDTGSNPVGDCLCLSMIVCNVEGSFYDGDHGFFTFSEVGGRVCEECKKLPKVAKRCHGVVSDFAGGGPWESRVMLWSQISGCDWDRFE